MNAHDLLEAVRSDAVLADIAVPGWVTERLARAPLVVVRRAPSRQGYLPVGVRGNTRSERFAAWLSPSDIKARIAPEHLVRRRAWQFTQRSAHVLHFALLERVAQEMRAHGLAWGPVGSVGYELASGVAAVTATSDLDLIVRARAEFSRKTARALAAKLTCLQIPVDVQLETPYGAVALSEYASGSRVALRTTYGPRLVDNPWIVHAPAAKLT